MKIKIVDTNLDVRPNLSPYFIQSIYDYYIGRLKGELLCWLYFNDKNYFLIGLEDPQDEYIECTPIIKIHDILKQILVTLKMIVVLKIY